MECGCEVCPEVATHTLDFTSVSVVHFVRVIRCVSRRWISTARSGVSCRFLGGVELAVATGHQSSGRRNHLGDRQVGDKPTGRQTTGRHILVNWATEVETTGPQLWKCERLSIAVLEQLCAVLGQRPLISFIKQTILHSSLECYDPVGLRFVMFWLIDYEPSKNWRL